MDQVRLSKSEWEAFLSEFLELSKKYELILTELDLTREKTTNLQQNIDRVSKTGPLTNGFMGPSQREDRMETSNRKRGLRELFRSRRFSTLVNTSKPANAKLGISTTSRVQCGRCGYQVTKPSRVCVRCGTSFGALYCICGRELKSNDKFCDGCGQKLLE
jgi:ribosomal protein S27AE